MIRPVILCGGGGTRLWPLSTPRRPKQFLNLDGAEPMLAQTVARVGDRTRFTRPLAIGAARHESLLRECAPHADLLLEPSGRNSAPPIAAACLLSEPEQLILVLPADHRIADLDAFLAAIDIGAEAARAGEIVTFGVKPDHAATGYGYIEAKGDGEIRPVKRFVEKPDAATAQIYVESGRFFWNAGIFLFSAETMRDAFARCAPDILAAVQNALSADGTLDQNAYEAVRAQSIDYAIMEEADNIAVVPVAMGWSDLGDFRALYDIATAGPGGVVSQGCSIVSGTARALVRSEGVRLVVQGLSDIAVIATPDGVLIKRLSDPSGLKGLTDALDELAPSAARPDQRAWLADWLWGRVMPAWAKLAVDSSGGFVEAVGFDGHVRSDLDRRGRVAPRQLFAFARAKRLGWNEAGSADRVIDAALAFLDGPGRAAQGGWVHGFSADGAVRDASRDLYDHAFVALAGSELAALGDARGAALAKTAFETIDRLFADADHGGWADPETAPHLKRANPHMHLLEASLAHYEATGEAATLRRIDTVAALFERWMFDSETGSVIEEFEPDWSRPRSPRVEPGHCYEWAHLLYNVQRLTGRDTVSWRRRLIEYSETRGIVAGRVVDVVGAEPATFRLWPQLERIRAVCDTPRSDVDPSRLLDGVISDYLKLRLPYGWVDRLNAAGQPEVETVPASMLYHLMTGLAPIAPPA